MSLATLSLAELRRRLVARDIAPADIIHDLATRRDALDSTLGGYLRFDVDRALAEAAHADLTRPLGGIPIALKDNINTSGDLCTCSSRFLANFRSPYDATVTRNLRQAGAILLGRCNMDEFAMGSSTENSALQPTRNPWDLSRVPGGSSGGSAAVVAADMAIASLGSDTGGSIRQPAAFCGVVGLKPTYGRVSRYGLVAFASSLDQIGPFAGSVEDAALLLSAIAGPDPMDNTSRPVPVPDYSASLGKDLRGLRIGIPKEYFVAGLDPEVHSAIRSAIDWFSNQGAQILDISLPHSSSATAVYYIIATAEASANLARFDGVRYGHRAAQPKDPLDLYRRSRQEGFGPEVKRRIILGTYVLSSGYYDAYYNRAQKVRQLIRRDFTHAFDQCDLILAPTTPTPAFKAGEKTSDPLQMYLADIFTIAANLAGVPALSLPCGFSASGLPIGLQLMAAHFAEPTLFNAADAYERAHPWKDRKPSL
ncbi:MAG: Asp-tRNA(Asn)/Glu-tRNA(Gln) amidotransferase subunit GatA [Verrucomicrobiia bacterium]